MPATSNAESRAGAYTAGGLLLGAGALAMFNHACAAQMAGDLVGAQTLAIQGLIFAGLITSMASGFSKSSTCQTAPLQQILPLPILASQLMTQSSCNSQIVSALLLTAGFANLMATKCQ